jgi:hypothetical protein
VTHRSFVEIREQLARNAIPLDDAVTELADAGREEELAALLRERVAGLGFDAGDVLQTAAEHPVAILCRAAGLSLNGYSAILRMRHRKRRPGRADPSTLLNAYVQLSKAGPAEMNAQLRTMVPLEPAD